MNEATGRISLPRTRSDAKSVRQRIYHTAYIPQVCFVLSSSSHYYAKFRCSGACFCWTNRVWGELSIELETMVLTVNTEKILLGNMLVQVIKKAF